MRVPYRPGFPGGLGAGQAQPGDYCLVPDGMDPRENGVWYCLDPGGGAGAILPSLHTVTVHDDGEITVSPSLVMPGGWHGWLEHGVWRSV
jgi:hypothetical protein